MSAIEESDEDEEDFEEDEELLVSRVDGEGSKPFYMEGMMRGSYFKAIIDTGPQFLFLPNAIYKKLWANEKS